MVQKNRKNLFRKDRPKIQSESFFIAKLKDKSKIGLVHHCSAVKNAIVLKHCEMVLFGNQKLFYDKSKNRFFF